MYDTMQVYAHTSSNDHTHVEVVCVYIVSGDDSTEQTKAMDMRQDQG